MRQICLLKGGKGLSLGPSDSKTEMIKQKPLPKKYKSELTAHHPLSTFLFKPNQPTYVIAIPGRSQGGG